MVFRYLNILVKPSRSEACTLGIREELSFGEFFIFVFVLMVEGFDVLSHVGIRVVRCRVSDVWCKGLCFSVEMGLTNLGS